MKCVKNLKTGEIERVHNELAQKLFNNQTHLFIPRKMWKEQVRDKK